MLQSEHTSSFYTRSKYKSFFCSLLSGNATGTQQLSSMVHIKDGLSFKSLLSVFQHIVVFLLLTHFCGGQSQEIRPPQPVMVMVGDDIVLPCRLEPARDAVSMTIEWGRPDLNPRFVYVWHDGQELLVDQNKAYKGRASLSMNKLKFGDLSLKLSKVNVSDNGTYRCYIPKLKKEYFVQLLVGAVSSPAISLVGIHEVSSGVILQCESAGWYPEPEVFWLDGEGKLVSAGSTETVRGPNDLYTVSSRVTVEKRHSNSFICRVQQQNINQTRETHIHVPDDFFMAPSSCTASTAISVLFGFMFILTVVLFVWKLRQNKSERKMRHKNENKEREGERSKEQLLTESNLEKIRKDKLRLNEELQKTEEEQKDMMQVIEALKGLTREMEKQKEKLTVQAEAAKRLAEENTKKLDSVEKEVSEKEGDKTAIKAQGYLKLREIITQTSWNLEERKTEHQQLQFNTDKLMKKTYDNINRITERKNKVENHMEQIKKQMEEIERQREVKEKREEL
ncbi:butyrophilin subfamily 2 member A2-like isoform X1 [Siniperca chuatsi]|uniref:butyrophilin subfamily 2 member A2-like isoform X1 n=2 Tax=Siniperca chuatsi TaxID=119488 RepID=UPI001CE15C48|nr:butyrophilin subfamily 2 member A2-like isoform X1 [Siniperca chuatsi]